MDTFGHDYEKKGTATRGRLHLFLVG